MVFLFFFYCSAAHRVLHSFPTRRSSDLSPRRGPRATMRAAPSGRACASRSSTTATRRCPTERPGGSASRHRSEEHTSELQSRRDLVCRLLLEKKKTQKTISTLLIITRRK